MESSNYWEYGYKTQHSNPRSRLITWRRPEVKFGRNVVRRNNKKKSYQDEDLFYDENAEAIGVMIRSVAENLLYTTVLLCSVIIQVKIEKKDQQFS